MDLHSNHHDATYAERRRSRQQEAAHWRLAAVAPRAAVAAGTLGMLLDEVGGAMPADLLDRPGPRRAMLVEALVAELVAIAAESDHRAAVLAPRDGEDPVVALRTLAALAQRGAVAPVPVSARRVAVVRDLVRQLGTDPAGDRWRASGRAGAGPAEQGGIGGASPLDAHLVTPCHSG